MIAFSMPISTDVRSLTYLTKSPRHVGLCSETCETAVFHVLIDSLTSSD